MVIRIQCYFFFILVHVFPTALILIHFHKGGHQRSEGVLMGRLACDAGTCPLRFGVPAGAPNVPAGAPNGDICVHAMTTSSGAPGLHKCLTGASGALDETRKASQMLITFVSWLTNAAKIHNVNTVVNTDG